MGGTKVHTPGVIAMSVLFARNVLEYWKASLELNEHANSLQLAMSWYSIIFVCDS